MSETLWMIMFPQVKRVEPQNQPVGQGFDDFTVSKDFTKTLPKSFYFEIYQKNMITIKMSNQKRGSCVLVPRFCPNQVAQR